MENRTLWSPPRHNTTNKRTRDELFTLNSCLDSRSFHPTEKCFLSDNIYDYFNVSQGKITVPGIDDGEESMLADVSRQKRLSKPTPVE